MLRAAGPAATVAARGPAARLDVRGVTIEGGGVVGASEGGQLQLRRVRVRGAVGCAVCARGAGSVIDAHDLHVEATLPADAGAAGVGATAGATLRAARVLVDATAGDGVLASGRGTTVSLTDALVRGTRTPSADGLSTGLRAESRAAFTAARVVVEHTAGVGAGATGAGTALALTDVVVRATSPAPGSGPGVGLYATAGAAVAASRVLVADTRGAGALVDGGAAIELSDAVVRGTRLVQSNVFFGALTAVGRARLAATRVLLADNDRFGVLAVGTEREPASAAKGTVVVLTDCVVRGTRPLGPDRPGAGTYAGSGASVAATRVHFADNDRFGAMALGTGASLELTDAVVSGTRFGADVPFGSGLYVAHGATLSATRTLLAGNLGAGAAAVGSGTTLALADSSVRATGSRHDGIYGRGLEAASGAQLTATHVLVRDSREIGISAVRAGTAATLRDVVVSGVEPSSQGFGLGIAAFGGARIDAERVAVVAAHGAGVVSSPLTELESGPPERTVVTATDLYVEDVRSSTIRFDTASPEPRPTGRTVAYGLHVGSGATLAATHAVVDRGGFGFFVTAGELRLRTAVLTRQLDAAGAANGVAPDALELVAVAAAGNANDAILRDIDLPAASSLPLPPPICPVEGCP